MGLRHPPESGPRFLAMGLFLLYPLKRAHLPSRSSHGVAVMSRLWRLRPCWEHTTLHVCSNRLKSNAH
jgi:hypothetical protein